MTAPNVNPGNIPNVPGAQPVSELGFAAHAARDEPAWREQIDGQWKDRANNSGIGSVFNAITGMLSNIGSIFGSLGDLFDITDAQGAQISNIQSDVDSITESPVKLTAVMLSSPGTTTSPERMPFTTPTRVPKGMTHLGGGLWRFDSAGEHDVTAQVEFWGGALMPPGTHMEILMRNASGAIVDGVTAHADSTANITVTNVTSFEVPAPGYTVEVRAWTDKIPLVGGSFRGIRGGYATTRFMVRKFDLEAT